MRIVLLTISLIIIGCSQQPAPPNFLVGESQSVDRLGILAQGGPGSGAGPGASGQLVRYA